MTNTTTMPRWMRFVSQHHNVDIVSHDTLRINGIAYDATGQNYDDIITKTDDRYTVRTVLAGTDRAAGCDESHDSIRDYLGY